MVDNTSNPTHSGFAAGVSSGGEHSGFSSHPHYEGFGNAAANSMAGFGGAVAGYAKSYDRSLRSNPYLHLGLAGAGALFLGYLFGRATSVPPEVAPIGSSSFDIDEGYDE